MFLQRFGIFGYGCYGHVSFLLVEDKSQNVPNLKTARGFAFVTYDTYKDVGCLSACGCPANVLNETSHNHVLELYQGHNHQTV